MRPFCPGVKPLKKYCASDFFGPGYDVFNDLVIRPALAGKAVNVLGRTDQPHTFTYIADFGKLLATLGTREEALGQVWFTPSAPAITQAELVKLLEAEGLVTTDHVVLEAVANDCVFGLMGAAILK